MSPRNTKIAGGREKEGREGHEREGEMKKKKISKDRTDMKDFSILCSICCPNFKLP